VCSSQARWCARTASALARRCGFAASAIDGTVKERAELLTKTAGIRGIVRLVPQVEDAQTGVFHSLNLLRSLQGLDGVPGHYIHDHRIGTGANRSRGVRFDRALQRDPDRAGWD